MPTAKLRVREHSHNAQRLAKLGDAIQAALRAVLNVVSSRKALRMTRWIPFLLGIPLPPAVGAFAQQPLASDLAEKWRASGEYFTWQSQGRDLKIFYACIGDTAKPAILMLHGFPTSSFDFHLLIQKLQPDFRFCTFDFPGYGLSDKPAAGYRYSLREDAEITRYFILNIAKLKEFALLSHDRGDSVALAFLELIEKSDSGVRITHQFITNGNLYMPLANLMEIQERLLDPSTSAAALKQVSPPLLAAKLGASLYTPPLEPADPEVRALASFFAYQSGTDVLPATIQYLNERKQFENEFLQTLARSSIPVTVAWGIHDVVAPVRVADYAWKTVLESRKAPADLWLMPCSSHYVQHDQPGELARIIRLEIMGEPPAAPANLSSDPCSPLLAAYHE
jgi:pimeloyl-ACP methyl ester carboxylesterase